MIKSLLTCQCQYESSITDISNDQYPSKSFALDILPFYNHNKNLCKYTHAKGYDNDF